MIDAVEKHVRLSGHQIEAIRSVIQDTFGVGAKVWLFGSRTDINRRGGDIDLLVDALDNDARHLVAARIKAAARLSLMLDEQDVDIVCKQYATAAFSESAISNGVALL